jgi:short-subunit dehydrogenase
MSLEVDVDQSVRGWALVTGASAGIGAEFCRQLAALGYPLVLVARREDRLQALASELEKDHGTTCFCLAADLSRPGAGRQLYQALEAESIEVGFLVNNAGYGVPGHFTVPDWQTHADFIELMMTAVCELSWLLLPGMQARGRGYIINVASLAGLVPASAGNTLYGPSKAFLIGFSQSLALENAQRGVVVSALCPGFTHSEFHDVSGARELVSKMPDYMWMNADEVVRYGIESVTRANPRVIAIPGRLNRFVATFFRLLPRSIALAMIKRQSVKFRVDRNRPDGE